jgi:hypothetical protein
MIYNEVDTINNFIIKYEKKIVILIADNFSDYIILLGENIKLYDTCILNNDNIDIYLTKKDKKINDISFKYNIKSFLIYLPQFHEIHENNKNYYNGYTDITNLELFNNSKLINHETPSFCELNIKKLQEYNYNNKNILQKQIDIINEYNIDGFAMYYYWFSTNTITNKNMIMENVLNSFFDNSINAKNKKIFFIWANENWTKNSENLINCNHITNEYTISNFINNINNLLNYFKNDCYLKIENKPVLFIHHPFYMTSDELSLFYLLINNSCIDQNYDGIHLVINSAFEKNINDFSDYKKYYSNLNYKNVNYEYKYFDKNLNANIIDYNLYINSDEHIKKNIINTIFFDFDNRVRLFKPITAEKQSINDISYKIIPEETHNVGCPTIIINNSELNKIIFAKKIVESYNRNYKSDIDNILLVNSWNEWGEKMAIEPSNEYEYYNLNLLIECLI